MNYKLLYCDPPWTYKDKASAGKRGAAHKYTLMTLQDLMKMPVPELMGQDSICMMWATAPLMPEAFKLLNAWGFEYKTIAFTWVKLCKPDARLLRSRNRFAFALAEIIELKDLFRDCLSRPRMGMGHYTRGNQEFVLVGKRGKGLKRINKAVPQVVMSEPLKPHSTKPVEVRDRINDLYGPVKRLELFSRSSGQDWDHWGNQSDDSVDIDALRCFKQNLTID